jgi:hypothetical protein
LVRGAAFSNGEGKIEKMRMEEMFLGTLRVLMEHGIDTPTSTRRAALGRALGGPARI